MSGSVIRRHTLGVGDRLGNRIFIGVAAVDRLPRGVNALDVVRVVRKESATETAIVGEVGGILTDLVQDAAPPWIREAAVPTIYSAEHLEHLHDGDIVRLDCARGLARTLYRVGSRFNTIFATDQCNSNCLMCSQPPKDVDDSGVVNEHLRFVSLIPPSTESLGITGGEPTLLGDGLIHILKACKKHLPITRLHLLTNGRTFCERTVAERLAAVNHPSLVLGIPLYSDVAWQHDHVVQAEGAFTQTMLGFHNLARYSIRLELRIVIHQQTWEHLPRLAEFIYRNLPFVEHVTFMGLEMMGYTKTNLKTLWIDPVDYQETLQDAVEVLDWAGMNVSIYNHQLCVLRPALWRFARKSISDFKNIYLDACASCSVLDRCGGLFKSAERLHSRDIAPIPLFGKS